MIQTMNIKTDIFLAGKWEERANKLKVWNPEDNQLICEVASASKEDLLYAIEEAKEGFDISSKLPVHERIAILNKVADYIELNQKEYTNIIVLESSKTIREAEKEVRRCIETIRISAEEARRIVGETISFDQMPGSENRLGYYYRFPIGIIAAITPFNDPLNLVAHKVGPAIAAGNAIIVKPASVTPLSALKLAEAFEYAGLPEKILSVLPGDAKEIGDTLVTSPAIRMVSFTGGLETGESIAKKAGLKKLSMELGSNSPAIVLKDANLTDAVESTVSGAFWAAGQNCLGVQRIYIEEEIYSDFATKFVERTNEYIVGEKASRYTDMGPLITEKEAIRVESWVNEAVEKGATILTGGKRQGAFYSPTVLINVPANCTLAQEEIFGPVVLLYPVANLDDAINESNRVPFGLQAGIFTANIQDAFHAIQKLEVGGVMINDSSDYRIDAMPFGGVKGSGLGREGVKYTIQDMTEPKVVIFKQSLAN